MSTSDDIGGRANREGNLNLSGRVAVQTERAPQIPRGDFISAYVKAYKADMTDAEFAEQLSKDFGGKRTVASVQYRVRTINEQLQSGEFKIVIKRDETGKETLLTGLPELKSAPKTRGARKIELDEDLGDWLSKLGND